MKNSTTSSAPEDGPFNVLVEGKTLILVVKSKQKNNNADISGPSGGISNSTGEAVSKQAGVDDLKAELTLPKSTKEDVLHVASNDEGFQESKGSEEKNELSAVDVLESSKGKSTTQKEESLSVASAPNGEGVQESKCVEKKNDPSAVDALENLKDKSAVPDPTQKEEASPVGPNDKGMQESKGAEEKNKPSTVDVLEDFKAECTAPDSTQQEEALPEGPIDEGVQASKVVEEKKDGDFGNVGNVNRNEKQEIEVSKTT